MSMWSRIAAGAAGIAMGLGMQHAAWGQYPGPPLTYPATQFGPEYAAPPPFFYGPPQPAYEGVAPGGESLLEAPPAASATPAELPPPSALEEVAEYEFFNPAFWFPTDGWSNSFEIGVNGSTGNSETFSLQTGAHIQRKVAPATFTLDLKYARTLADSVETQHNALMNSNVESSLGETRFTTFFKTYLEYDEFKAWNVRVAMNAGVGYRVVATDTTKFIVRFGSGVSREIGGPDDDYVPEAVYGLEFDRRISKRQKLYATVDYFPDWTNYRDYRLVTNGGWELLLDDDANLSLKLGAIDRYDSTPHGRKPNDLNYSLVLLWKQ